MHRQTVVNLGHLQRIFYTSEPHFVLDQIQPQLVASRGCEAESGDRSVGKLKCGAKEAGKRNSRAGLGKAADMLAEVDNSAQAGGQRRTSTLN
jgi:hypothetical protein